MSADRIKGEVVFICDACDETLETGETDFEAARTAMRLEGWHAHRDRHASDGWSHECAGCSTPKAGFRDLDR